MKKKMESVGASVSEERKRRVSQRLVPVIAPPAKASANPLNVGQTDFTPADLPPPSQADNSSNIGQTLSSKEVDSSRRNADDLPLTGEELLISLCSRIRDAESARPKETSPTDLGAALTLREVQMRTGASRSTVDRWRYHLPKDRQLKQVKINGYVRVYELHLKAFLESNSR